MKARMAFIGVLVAFLSATPLGSWADNLGQKADTSGYSPRNTRPNGSSLSACRTDSTASSPEPNGCIIRENHLSLTTCPAFEKKEWLRRKLWLQKGYRWSFFC